MATRNPDQIEVIEAFSYGCPYCYQLEAHVRVWEPTLDNDVDFHHFHAAWNDSMRLYAQAFFTARELGVLEQIHVPLFNALQAQQRQLTSPKMLAEFFTEHGVEQARFIEVFRSSAVQQHVAAAEERVAEYELSGVPQFIVNGKYRVDPVRAEGRKEMLDVVDYLIDKERELLKSSGSAGGR
ncbi:MAG: thiol:disulfide interchange protein DsbA/DsbL [Wenzhouxiangellaceae bacterium]